MELPHESHCPYRSKIVSLGTVDNRRQRFAVEFWKNLKTKVADTLPRTGVTRLFDVHPFKGWIPPERSSQQINLPKAGLGMLWTYVVPLARSDLSGLGIR